MLRVITTLVTRRPRLYSRDSTIHLGPHPSVGRSPDPGRSQRQGQARCQIPNLDPSLDQIFTRTQT